MRRMLSLCIALALSGCDGTPANSPSVKCDRIRDLSERIQGGKSFEAQGRVALGNEAAVFRVIRSTSRLLMGVSAAFEGEPTASVPMLWTYRSSNTVSWVGSGVGLEVLPSTWTELVSEPELSNPFASFEEACEGPDDALVDGRLVAELPGVGKVELVTLDLMPLTPRTASMIPDLVSG